MTLPLTDPSNSPNERRGLEEYTRHTGHADILREDIDGEIGD
ncbi:DinB family protein [Brevibacterium sp. JSBI002]|nr:DinB family protein [Brevibacterium sp. JSBI002]UZD63501.1 DinB family protein [Brevibacterium sp. JSBI002]